MPSFLAVSAARFWGDPATLREQSRPIEGTTEPFLKARCSFLQSESTLEALTALRDPEARREEGAEALLFGLASVGTCKAGNNCIKGYRRPIEQKVPFSFLSFI